MKNSHKLFLVAGLATSALVTVQPVLAQGIATMYQEEQSDTSQAKQQIQQDYKADLKYQQQLKADKQHLTADQLNAQQDIKDKAELAKANLHNKAAKTKQNMHSMKNGMKMSDADMAKMDMPRR